MTYTIKAVKTFHGHDGYGWEANLYHGKTKIALVVEDGYGGGLQFYFTDEKAPRIKTNGLDFKDEAHTFNDTPSESALRTFCITLPKWELYNGKMKHTDMEIFVDGLVQAKLTEKDVKKLLKKVAIFDDGEVYTYNRPAAQADALSAQIFKSHPKAIILNTLPLAEAVTLYKQVA